jgi:hypothetical protein
VLNLAAALAARNEKSGATYPLAPRESPMRLPWPVDTDTA